MRLNNLNLITYVHNKIKDHIEREFEAIEYISGIEIPVDIEKEGNTVKVYFNLSAYQSKTTIALCEDISRHTSYCYDVDLAMSDRYGELVLTYQND